MTKHKTTPGAFSGKYFDPSLDLRVQVFNLLCFAGIAAGIIAAAVCTLQKTGAVAVAFNLIPSALAVLLLCAAGKKLSLRVCCWIAVGFVFMVAFPVQFFATGGYRGGTPVFFIFAIIFTAILFERWERTAALAALFALYVGCCLAAYFYPETVTPLKTEADYVGDVIAGVVVTGVLVLFVILLHIRIYDNRQKQLEEANARLNALNGMKTEFLQDIKHEIRNPLHVISLGTDSAHEYIDAEDGAAAAHNVLNNVQNEALRLGRMINGMVELATMSGGQAGREKIDFAAMLNTCAEATRLQIEKKQNALRVRIAPGLPYVYAEAGQLARVPVNLLSNAADCTKGGEIALEASFDTKYITVRVSDTGAGIAPELLPRVFERGVSGKGGKGYGLSICKTILEAHGGSIEIESETGKGTCVIFQVPVYGGQDEESAHER